jgi:hypothetical protein
MIYVGHAIILIDGSGFSIMVFPVLKPFSIEKATTLRSV